MRKGFRVIFLFLLSLLGTAVLSSVAAVVAAISLAATALIVPGTGTPNANGIGSYMENFRDYYMRTTPCVEGDCDAPYNPATGEGLLGINYPASFWPIPLPGWCPHLSCDKFDVSVSKGVQNLDSALTSLKDLGYTGDVVIAGYSQGARVASIEKAKFVRGDWDDLLTQFDSVSFVFIGNPNRPNGGILSRLGFLGHIPLLDVTTGQPAPTGPPYFHTEDWAIRWEGIADWPTYLLNPLAVANSILGFAYDHGTYLAFNQDSDPGETPAGYSLAEWRELTAHPELYPDNVNIQQYGDTTYYTVTPKTLPLVRPLHLVPLVGKPIADLIEPALRVIIEETGYARGIPFGAPIGTGLIPIFNPVTLFLKLIPAVVVGVNNFLPNFGVGHEIPLTPPIPVPPAASTLMDKQQSELDKTPLTDDPDKSSEARLMARSNRDQQVEPEKSAIDGNVPEKLTDPEKLTEPEKLTDPVKLTEPKKLANDPEESRDPQDNTVDANGGSVSLSFSPHDNKPGESQSKGGGESTEQPTVATDPTPAAPSKPGVDADSGSKDSEPAAA